VILITVSRNARKSTGSSKSSATRRSNITRSTSATNRSWRAYIARQQWLHVHTSTMTESTYRQTQWSSFNSCWGLCTSCVTSRKAAKAGQVVKEVWRKAASQGAPPKNHLFPCGYPGPSLIHGFLNPFSPHPKGHLDWFSRFRAYGCVQRTHTHTQITLHL